MFVLLRKTTLNGNIRGEGLRGEKNDEECVKNATL